MSVLPHSVRLGLDSLDGVEEGHILLTPNPLLLAVDSAQQLSIIAQVGARCWLSSRGHGAADLSSLNDELQLSFIAGGLRVVADLDGIDALFAAGGLTNRSDVEERCTVKGGVVVHQEGCFLLGQMMGAPQLVLQQLHIRADSRSARRVVASSNTSTCRVQARIRYDVATEDC